MKTEVCAAPGLIDFQPPSESLGSEFIAGLRRRILPCKFFYDERGSRLFDRICQLEEYYLTRTEAKILRQNIAQIAALCGPRCVLVELGSGNSRKTRLLLDHLERPVAYVPIDISRTHLVRAAKGLNGDYFPLEILPVCADYNRPLTLPPPSRTPERSVIFFPGSTIGNFEPWAAAAFLRRIASWCEPGDGLLIGVDLEKSSEILELAYNDAQGVTAAFNLNLLHRANTELGANFAFEQFRHQAIYDEERGRIEMRLISRCEQRVIIGGEEFDFGRNEYVTTEYSYKYRLEDFYELAAAAGWHAKQTWTDEKQWFSVNYFQQAR